jgi:predicted metal-dependent HD superfamily phosphohydrolase
MKINSEIVKACASHVSEYLPAHLDKKFTYHNLSHTLTVVKAVDKLSDKLVTDEHEKEILQVAAWFHDTGYTEGTDNHEFSGCLIAERFLSRLDVNDEDISTVKSCIMATRYPQHPETLLQQILCDADMIHLGKKNFCEGSALLRKEWKLTKAVSYSDKEWHELNIKFLSFHQFYTSYCLENTEPKKQKNIERLRELLSPVVDHEINGSKVHPAGKFPVKQKKVNDRLERGVETFFRSASSNHMRLSGMADNKAHILLSINSIIISIILSVLAKKLAEASFFIIPTILLLMVSATSIVFAVLTTKPKVSKGVFTKKEITNREVNLLFFGNFHQMDLESYEWGVKEMMYDKEYLYRSMTKDIYFLGKVLAAKYRYLNIGYRVFMYGLVASIIAYGVSFIIA